MAKSRPALEIKGRMLSLTRVRILDADLGAIEAQLQTFTRSLGEAGAGLPVLLEADSPLPLRPLLDLFRAAGVQPLGVVDGALAAAAVELGLAVIGTDLFTDLSGRGAASVPRAAETVASAPEPAPAPAAVAAARKSTRVVMEPIRSGQQIYADNADLVVMNTVSPGAEVIADGCVHVYGALRGRAIAGARGDTQARVFCRRMEAELLAVAGIYAVADQMQGALRGQAVQALLVNGALKIEKLEG